MERLPVQDTPASRTGLTPDQIEAIARQQPGRHQPDLMRLQHGTGELKRPTGPLAR